MQLFYDRIMNAVHSDLLLIHKEPAEIHKQAEKACIMLQCQYSKLESFILGYSFKNANEEILYFKKMKPALAAKLIYFSSVYHFEHNKPQGSFKVKRKYVLNELKKITAEFEDNADFIKYYRADEEYLDHVYFMRNNIDFKLSADAFIFALDKKHSTNYDLKAAKVIANEMLQVYFTAILKELDSLDSEAGTKPNEKIFKWTESKTALIELIYAIYVSGVIENGKADIKDIATFCERTFGIELGDVYHTFKEIKMRKTGRTKFRDLLKEKLLKKMDEQDEK